MTTNKERIDRMEAGLGEVQDKMQRMELGMANIEATLSKLVDSINTTRNSPSVNNNAATSRPVREDTPGGRQQFQSKVAKLEFPRYSGDDPTEWFNRANQFFEYQDSADDEKVVLASFHLEGEANQWWQWLRRSYQEEGKTVTWQEFVEELWARFGPTDCEDFDEALSHIKQTGTLREYQKEFERLGNRVQGWTQKALVGTFMGGLKSEISEEIRLFRPRTLKDAISFARMRDEQLSRQKRMTRSPFANRPPANQITNARASPTVPFKRLSWEEMQRRRTQGLCFSCNEKFTAGHKCSKAQLLILDGEIDEPDRGESNETALYSNEQENDDKPKITFYALTGWTAPQTMRVKAKIGLHEIVVLIDSGSTHNFINTRLANTLQLPVQPTAAFSVKVANGEKVTCQGRHGKVPVIIQGVPFKLTLYSLPITGLDVVLGIQWLEKLGSVVCNWKSLTMDFNWNNEKQRLQGMGPQTIQAATLTEITKEMRHGHSIFAICLQLDQEEPFTVAPIGIKKIIGGIYGLISGAQATATGARN